MKPTDLHGKIKIKKTEIEVEKNPDKKKKKELELKTLHKKREIDFLKSQIKQVDKNLKK